MSTSVCFVCGLSLEQFDEGAANFHLNACLDGGGSLGTEGASKTASNGPDSSGIALITRPAVPQCPLCDKTLPLDELQDHVEACLLATQDAAGASNPEASGTHSGSSLVDESMSSCPCCLLDWTSIDVPVQDRDLHVADCLSQAQALREDDDEDDSGEAMTESRLQTVLENFKSNGFGKMRSAWKGKGTHTSVTPNLIPQLQTLLEKCPSTRLAVLCSSKTEHIKSQFGDFGWGCGYKSACMVFSALRHVQQYQNMLLAENDGRLGLPNDQASSAESGKRKAEKEGEGDDTGAAEDAGEVAAIPTIEELQQIAEAAWAAGFDPDGEKHFNGKLVGSRRWIGTSEVYTMFTWLGIRVTVIDFPKVAGTAGAHNVLAKWVFDYFKTHLDIPDGNKDAFATMMNTKGSSVRVFEDRMPLYLQHQGHSRVIIGVEQTKAGELNLLLFDCGKKINEELKQAANAASSKSKHKKLRTIIGGSSSSSGVAAALSPKLLEPYRVNLKSLSKKDEYQILRVEVEGGPLTTREKLARREITSLRVT
ncbi:DUF1671-domain-containing protein [Cystobasidium minutum MCA 4210]|uniref:DUF1671-domain-containing protein n=1 Tax=Cystobasidium minutum MCA 4210 TaxID=1397322 RepID=UPI0034CE01FA|eukprot:jgi/Rhomi1/196163/gm1.4377_g